MPEQLNPVRRTKYAVGHYLTDDPKDKKSFSNMMKLYADRFLEVDFPWPTMNNARGCHYRKPGEKGRVVADLKYCRAHGMQLNLLLNATCYGDNAFTKEQRVEIRATIEELDSLGLRPNIVTTTSPYIAKVFKKFIPDVEVRASVNIRLRNTLAFEYMANLFDSYYLCRDVQRDLPTILMFEKWCKEHDKKLCILANSGCLRNCSFQVFHETLVSHNYLKKHMEMLNQNFGLACNSIYKRKQYVEMIRADWIRPEDIHLWEPHVSVIKLSTRDVEMPDLIMKAYLDEKWDGNLLHLLDPTFTAFFRPYKIDNTKFPKDWATSGIGGKCADNCVNCGKCDKILEQVLVKDTEQVSAKPASNNRQKFQFTFKPLVAPSMTKKF